MSLATHGWGRGPLVTVGVALAFLLAALASLVVGAATDELLSGAILAALLVCAALLTLAVLAVLLVRDRFPRQVASRLLDIEGRLATLEGAPPSASTGPAPSREDARAVPAPLAPTVPDTAATTPGGGIGSPEEPPAERTPEPAPRPARSNVSWELLLGGRALAAIGGLVLLVAVGLFLKFGWDQGWFRPSPEARVALGLAAGGALLALGELARRRERFAGLSQVLTAVGLGAVYVSVWAAHGLYHLVEAGPALLLLAAAAAAGVVLATATGGRAVASLSTVGGLLAPVVVELGPRPPTAMYVYLLVLLAAAAAVAAGRRWPELGPIALAGTAVHTAAAFAWTWPDESGRLVDAGFLLAAIVLLVGVSLGFSWRRRVAPAPVELAVLGAASLAGWAAGLVRIEPLGEVAGGLWTLGVLLVKLAAAHVLLLRIGREAGGRRLFLAVAALLLVALPPVVWDGAWVAALWALEALVAVTVSRSSATGAAGAAVAVLAALRAVGVADGPSPDAPFASSDFLLLGVAAALLIALLVVAESRRRRGPATAAEWVAAPAALAATLSWLTPEVFAWSRARFGLGEAYGAVALAGALLLAAAAGGLLAGWRHRTAVVTWLTGVGAAAGSLLWVENLDGLESWHAAGAAAPLPVAAAAALGCALVAADQRRVRTAVGLGAGVAVVAALVRLPLGWPGHDVVRGGLLPAIVAAAAGGLLLAAGRRRLPDSAGRWLECCGWTVLVVAAARALAVAVALAPPSADADSARAGLVALSVLWGGAGLGLVLAGLTSGAPHRRMLGLALLAATVLKVFLFDLAAAPTVLRIVAFLVTGLALLAGAWLYARYRERLEPAS